MNQIPQERDTRLDTDPDFILLKRFGFSLDKLLMRYPDEVPDETIAQALGIPAGEVPARYDSIVARLRSKLAAQ
jgi:hypothetical protein